MQVKAGEELYLKIMEPNMKVPTHAGQSLIEDFKQKLIDGGSTTAHDLTNSEVAMLYINHLADETQRLTDLQNDLLTDARIKESDVFVNDKVLAKPDFALDSQIFIEWKEMEADLQSKLNSAYGKPSVNYGFAEPGSKPRRVSDQVPWAYQKVELLQSRITDWLTDKWTPKGIREDATIRDARVKYMQRYHLGSLKPQTQAYDAYTYLSRLRLYEAQRSLLFHMRKYFPQAAEMKFPEHPMGRMDPLDAQKLAELAEEVLLENPVDAWQKPKFRIKKSLRLRHAKKILAAARKLRSDLGAEQALRRIERIIEGGDPPETVANVIREQFGDVVGPDGLPRDELIARIAKKSKIDLPADYRATKEGMTMYQVAMLRSYDVALADLAVKFDKVNEFVMHVRDVRKNMIDGTDPKLDAKWEEAIKDPRSLLRAESETVYVFMRNMAEEYKRIEKSRAGLDLSNHLFRAAHVFKIGIDASLNPYKSMLEGGFFNEMKGIEIQNNIKTMLRDVSRSLFSMDIMFKGKGLLRGSSHSVKIQKYGRDAHVAVGAAKLALDTARIEHARTHREWYSTSFNVRRLTEMDRFLPVVEDFVSHYNQVFAASNFWMTKSQIQRLAIRGIDENAVYVPGTMAELSAADADTQINPGPSGFKYEKAMSKLLKNLTSYQSRRLSNLIKSVSDQLKNGHFLDIPLREYSDKQLLNILREMIALQKATGNREVQMDILDPLIAILEQRGQDMSDYMSGGDFGKSKKKPEPEPDAEREAEPEPEADAEREAEPDAEREAEPDAEREAEPDPEPEAEAEQDPGRQDTDGGRRGRAGERDAGERQGADEGRDPTPEPEPDNERDTQADTEPDPEPGPTPDAERPPGPDAEAAPEPDGEPGTGGGGGAGVEGIRSAIKANLGVRTTGDTGLTPAAIVGEIRDTIRQGPAEARGRLEGEVREEEVKGIGEGAETADDGARDETGLVRLAEGDPVDIIIADNQARHEKIKEFSAYVRDLIEQRDAYRNSEFWETMDQDEQEILGWFRDFIKRHPEMADALDEKYLGTLATISGNQPVPSLRLSTKAEVLQFIRYWNRLDRLKIRPSDDLPKMRKLHGYMFPEVIGEKLLPHDMKWDERRSMVNVGGNKLIMQNVMEPVSTMGRLYNTDVTAERSREQHFNRVRADWEATTKELNSALAHVARVGKTSKRQVRRLAWKIAHSRRLLRHYEILEPVGDPEYAEMVEEARALQIKRARKRLRELIGEWKKKNLGSLDIIKALDEAESEFIERHWNKDSNAGVMVRVEEGRVDLKKTIAKITKDINRTGVFPDLGFDQLHELEAAMRFGSQRIEGIRVMDMDSGRQDALWAKQRNRFTSEEYVNDVNPDTFFPFFSKNEMQMYRSYVHLWMNKDRYRHMMRGLGLEGYMKGMSQFLETAGDPEAARDNLYSPGFFFDPTAMNTLSSFLRPQFGFDTSDALMSNWFEGTVRGKMKQFSHILSQYEIGNFETKDVNNERRAAWGLFMRIYNQHRLGKPTQWPRKLMDASAIIVDESGKPTIRYGEGGEEPWKAGIDNPEFRFSTSSMAMFTDTKWMEKAHREFVDQFRKGDFREKIGDLDAREIVSRRIADKIQETEERIQELGEERRHVLELGIRVFSAKNEVVQTAYRNDVTQAMKYLRDQIYIDTGRLKFAELHPEQVKKMEEYLTELKWLMDDADPLDDSYEALHKEIDVVEKWFSENTTETTEHIHEVHKNTLKAFEKAEDNHFKPDRATWAQAKHFQIQEAYKELDGYNKAWARQENEPPTQHSQALLKAKMSQVPVSAARKAMQLRHFSEYAARYELISLLSHPKVWMGNMFGGSVNTIIHVGLRHWWRAGNINYLRSKISKDFNNWDDVAKFAKKHGVAETQIRHEMEVADNIAEGSLTKTAKLELLVRRRLAANMGQPLTKADYVDLAFKSGLSEQAVRWSAEFIQDSEQRLRVRAWIAAYLQARDQFNYNGFAHDIDDPYMVHMANEATIATQFLYNNGAKPLFLSSNMGKVFFRFKTWIGRSVRFTTQIRRDAANFNYEGNSVQMARLERYIIAMMFIQALATLFPFSLFDNAMPAPVEQVSSMSKVFFGSERDRHALLGGKNRFGVSSILWRQAAPTVARLPEGLFVSAVTNEWDRYADKYLWNLFPAGRAAKSIDRVLQFDDRTGNSIYKYKRPSTGEGLIKWDEVTWEFTGLASPRELGQTLMSQMPDD